MQAGSPFSHLIDFSTGLPTGAVVYSVLGNDNIPLSGLDNVSVAVAPDTLSILVIVPGSANICTKPLFETRTLVWTYPTSVGVVNGRIRYRIEREIPFPVTEHGVRSKLGVEDHEVEDRDINLLMAYASLSSKYTTGALDAYATLGNLETLIVVEAIEAQAAIDILPSLQLAVAKAEDSGTNKYQRFTSIDWQGLGESLANTVGRLDSQMGVTGENLIGVVFTAVGKSNDPITGAIYV